MELLLEEFAKDAERGTVQAAPLRRLTAVARRRRRRRGSGNAAWLRAPASSPRVADDRRQNVVDLVVEQRRHFQELAATFRAQLLTFYNVHVAQTCAR